MTKYLIIILIIFSFFNKSSIAQLNDGDTLVIHPVSFETPSPEGWGAQYKERVSFPENNKQWARIILVQTLKCDSSTKADKYPCGEWDYIWNTFINVPTKDSFEVFSIGSFVTPYGKRLWLDGEKGWQWEYDVTDYAPILKGDLEITTGNNQELLDLKFLFIKGKPVRDILSVENIYPYGNYKYEHLATDSVLKSKKLVLLAKAEAYKLKAIISGHGHAGPRNCCEWDSKTHSYYINDWDHFRWNVWKDCGNNPIYPQGGTWPFDRAGWCPGTKVDEYEFELTPLVTPGDTIDFNYGIEYFTDNGEKDGQFRMSHQIISYGKPNFKNDAAIVDIITPSSADKYKRLNPDCSNPRIIIQNTGAYSLNSLQITYGLKNGYKTTYQWFGNLNFLDKEEVWLPIPDWTGLSKNQEFIVTISNPNNSNDENELNNILLSGIDLPKILPSEFILQIKTNNVGRAKENSFTISDNVGKVLYSKNDFTDSTEYNLEIKLNDGFYKFLFLDDVEDGISVHWWNRVDAPEKVGISGKITIISIDGTELHKFHSSFGQELLLNFRVGEFE